MKLRLIKALDWFDDHVLCHRAYTIVPRYPGGLCHFIATSSWWGGAALEGDDKGGE